MITIASFTSKNIKSIALFLDRLIRERALLINDLSTNPNCFRFLNHAISGAKKLSFKEKMEPINPTGDNFKKLRLCTKR